MTSVLKIIGIVIMSLGGIPLAFNIDLGIYLFLICIIFGFIVFIAGFTVSANKRIGVRYRSQQPLKLETEPQHDKRCPSCGQLLPADVVTCPNCLEKPQDEEKEEDEFVEEPSTSYQVEGIGKKNIVIVAVIVVIFLILIISAVAVYIYFSNLSPYSNESIGIITVDVWSTYEYVSPGEILVENVTYLEIYCHPYTTKSYEINLNDLSEKKDNYTITLKVTSLGEEKSDIVFNVSEYAKFHVDGQSTYMDDIYKDTFSVECVESR